MGSKGEGKRKQATAFIESFKTVALAEGLLVVDREKNLQALIDLNMTKAERLAVFLGISANDYVGGPEADLDAERGGMVWVFGTEYEGIEIYVKLKLDIFGRTKVAKCISFHKADYKMSYPFK